jgi:CubicO group peptidase (beta-lactamase class C family)/D-aminopeptidase/pimeloyl-ACP methyl ester carboxylesterase
MISEVRMRRLGLSFTILLGVAAVGACAPATQGGAAAGAPASSDTASPDSIDVLVQQHMDSLEIPGISLAVMRGSEVVKVAAYGRANVELDAAATPLTVFPYASMTRVFTGTAVLRLVQQGRLSIEDRITDLLPDLPEDWEAVKLRHVLDHTSGLPDLNIFQAFTNPFLALTDTREELLAALTAQPVQYAPGGGFAYNQTNSLLLALLLEQHDGRTIEQYVREEFAESLGLGSLVYGDSRRSVPARASWYTRLDFTSGLPPKPTARRPLWIEYPPWLHTAAGLNGTALDLARFVAAVASGTLLDPTLRREMWTPARLSDGSVFRFEDGSTGAGLGWWVHDDPANYWAGMGGAASGALRHYIDERLTVVVLTNLQGSAPEEIVEQIAESYLRRPAEEAVSQPGSAPPHDAPFESRFIDAGGIRLHYLDFGGEGLPVVFLHSESWDASTYQDFAPRFTDRNRVLALTRRGYGESGGHGGGYDVPTQAESVLQFLDALGIERAVFAGNSSPTVQLTYLAEDDPDRVAGVIYLAGLLTPWLREVRESDPAGAGIMAARASASDATARERREALFSYRPEFLAGDRPPIEVPALAFAGRSGTIGHERFSEPLALVGSPLMADFFAALPPSPFRDHFQRLIEDPAFRFESLRAIEDPEARGFLLRLAEDPEMQAEVWRYQLEVAGPAVLAAQERFARAFGDPLRIVRLDLPVVYGYEYRDTPEMIEPHVRRFLEDVALREGARQPSHGYTLEPPRRDAHGVLRVLVYYDMEGLSGQDDWRTSLFRYPEQYRRGQELLAADVNAVIDGLVAGGADEVHVVDGHSSGNPEPDLRPELLNPRAHHLLRDEPFDAYTHLVEAGVYDAVVAVGMHAKSGSRGFISHTGVPGTQLLLEGRSITETELLAFSWGRVGVPVIFASGDDVLREDLSTMPWLEYVTVKEAVSADSARLRPVEEVRADLRTGAKRAVESLSRMRVMRPEPPLRAALRAIPPADLSALEGLPGITYDDGKVSLSAACRVSWGRGGASTPMSGSCLPMSGGTSNGRKRRMRVSWAIQWSGRRTPAWCAR